MLKNSVSVLAALLLLPLSAPASSGAAHPVYPAIPEPMVFDMMRPLGAAAGELEVNTLMMAPLSGDPRDIAWAPEIEYAFADGMAIEFELPFVNSRLDAYKLGLQGALGRFNGGRTAHGLQYLAIQARDGGHFSSSLLYMLGHRYDARWSSMSMIGAADISLSGGGGRNALLVNHALFWTVADTTLGLEVNYRDGHDGACLLMPQWHHKLPAALNLQFGAGAEKPRHAQWQAQLGLRLIREF